MMSTYSSSLPWQKLPGHQSPKRSTIRNQKIILDQRKARINIIAKHVTVGIVAVDRNIDDCIVNQPILRDVCIVERGSSEIASVGFGGDDFSLIGEVVDVTRCYVGEIRIPCS